MSLFAPAIEMRPTDSEIAIVLRPVVGDGGHQNFLREVLELIDVTTGAWFLEDDMLQRCYRYAYGSDYGGGGHQDRYRTIVAIAVRGGWVAP